MHGAVTRGDKDRAADGVNRRNKRKTSAACQVVLREAGVRGGWLWTYVAAPSGSGLRGFSTSATVQLASTAGYDMAELSRLGKVISRRHWARLAVRLHVRFVDVVGRGRWVRAEARPPDGLSGPRHRNKEWRCVAVSPLFPPPVRQAIDTASREAHFRPWTSPACRRSARTLAKGRPARQRPVPGKLAGGRRALPRGRDVSYCTR